MPNKTACILTSRALSNHDPNLKWKALFIVFVILASIYLLSGIRRSLLRAQSGQLQPSIRLGLDLQGGTHLIFRFRCRMPSRSKQTNGGPAQ